MDRENDAELPYDGTEGFSGSDTSEERARTEALEGIASVRQRYVLILARQAGEKGITVSEIRDVGRMHHGAMSGSLSVLHGAGRLARLTERRNKCKVYVLPEFVAGRETEGRRGNFRADALLAQIWDRIPARYRDDSQAAVPPDEDAEALKDIAAILNGWTSRKKRKEGKG